MTAREASGAVGRDPDEGTGGGDVPPAGDGERTAGAADGDAGAAAGEGAGPLAGGGRTGPLARIRRLLGGLPSFGKLLFRLLGDGRVSLLDRAIFGAALVYLFVPMDLVPDWVPGLGQLDDLLIVGVTLDRLLHRTDRAVLADHWDGDEASLVELRRLLDRAVGVLPRWVRGLLRAG